MPIKNSLGNIHLLLVSIVALVILGFAVYQNFLTDFNVTAGRPTTSTPPPSITCSNLPIINEFNQSATFWSTKPADKAVVVSPNTIRLDKDFTIETWVKFKQLDNANGGVRRTIFSRSGLPESSQVFLNLEPYGSNNLMGYRLRLGIGGASDTVVGNSVLLPNSWYHITAVKKADKAMLFVNGRKEDDIDPNKVGTISNPVTDNGGLQFVIGNVYYDGQIKGENNLDGQLDEFRVSNIARYEANFAVSATPFSPDSNTLALYRFDGDASDITGSNIGQILGEVLHENSNVQYSPDPDFDGWSDCKEAMTGTNPKIACPADRKAAVWPPDINNDRAVTMDDYRLVNNAWERGKTDKRYDINTDGKVDYNDQNIMAYYVNQTCKL